MERSPSENDDPKLITPRDVANRLGVETTTLANWRSNRRYRLPFVRVGRKIMYRKGDVDRFIASRYDDGSPSETSSQSTSTSGT